MQKSSQFAMLKSMSGKYFLNLKCEKKKTQDWDAECSKHNHNHCLKWNIWTQKVDNCNWNALPKLKLCKCSLLQPEFRYKTPRTNLRYNEKPSKQMDEAKWSPVMECWKEMILNSLSKRQRLVVQIGTQYCIQDGTMNKILVSYYFLGLSSVFK